ncbi:probable ATP-dependent RNA helicase DDX20 [Drosophila eugracilis]|uniref:probable ATP-dependent RNA helicase DDX20 n=1 Tax=Drosophila eugracilis TaxID=29029 RepID=UPI0007E6F852|nr:probable ATP-dependent RNA helicase DDX20 [Drosophila eugracilis]
MEREIAHNLSGGEQRTNDVAPGQVKTFAELSLSRILLRGLKRHNFVTPTKIQAAAIPMALSNIDLLVQSKSGTGKTLIYVITAMQSYHAKMSRPHALIVVPTRELAIQVQDTFFYLCEFYPDFKSAAFIGGTDVTKDRKRIQNSRIIIGTPGRLLHLYQNRVLDVSKLKLLVLDEADQLYQTKSLQDTVNQLIEVLPKNRQIIACSATYDQDLDERLAKIMTKPMLISNSERATVLLGIRQFVYELPQQTNSAEEMRLKLEVLAQIFNQLPYEQAVLFASSQMRADSYRNYLTASGVQCNLISGAMDQSERLNVFEGYRNFTMRILVATDLMARGVDSPHANLVINLDPPQDHVTYLHRIGRAGRFGSKGIAITFIASQKESQKFKQMSQKIATAWSVLEFPKEPMPKEFNFWDFDKYNFGYYIKEDNPLQEMPEKRKYSLQNGEEEKVLDKTEKPEALENRKKLEKDLNKSRIGGEKLPEALENVDKQIIDNKKNIETKEKMDLDNLPSTSQKNKNTNLSKQSKMEISKQAKKVPLAEEEALKMYETSTTKQDKPNRSINPSKLFTDALAGIEKQNTEDERLLTPVITVNEYYKDDTSYKSTGNKENQPDNGTGCPLQIKNILNAGEITSPELTPNLTQEPSPTTVTPPAPPVNSINNKTYCLAAPTQTSSMTIQNMVISNTVDDASSISSDSMGCGYHSDKSYDTIYTTSDEELIWERFETNQKRKLKKSKAKRRQLLYQKQQPEPKSNLNVRRKPIPMTPKLYTNISLLTGGNLYHLLKKFKNRERILEKLQDLRRKENMNNTKAAILLDKFYATMLSIYYDNPMESNKKVLQSLKEDLVSIGYSPSQESLLLENPEPQNKLSVHITNRMDIPPLPQAVVAEVALRSGSESVASEDFGNEEDDYDDDEDDLSDEEHNSSSGFVESTDSASSGIDTSVYETEPSTYTSDNSDSESDYLFDVTADDSASDDENASNVSLAGSSSKGSVELTSTGESSDDESITVTNAFPVQSLANSAQSMWVKTFNTQYQFIANHVANHFKNSN